MKSLIKNTPQGNVPQIPSVEDLMTGLGVHGWAKSGLGAEGQEPVRNDTTKDDLKRNYAAVFGSPAGQKVLEDLMDITLRRSFDPPVPAPTIEQTALHTRFRSGQNSIAVHIIAMLQQGRVLPAPGAKTKRKK
jgi:hypothetical protein